MSLSDDQYAAFAAAYQKLGSAVLAAAEIGVTRSLVQRFLAKRGMKLMDVANVVVGRKRKFVKGAKPVLVPHFERSAIPDPDEIAGGPSLPDPDSEVYEDYRVDSPGTWLVLSDTHIPYHDKRAIELAVAEGRRRSVVGVLLNGDILDFYQISRFSRDPSRPRVKSEIEKGRQFIAWLRSQFPRAMIVFKEGNHDERLRTYLADRAPELFDLDDLELSRLLRASDAGVEWVGDRRVVMLGKLPVIHGHEYQGSGGVMPSRWLFIRSWSSALCFPAGTTVLCRDGVRDIETVRVGDEVLTHDGNWKPVVRTMRRHAEETVTLKGYGHPGLTTTPDHPIRTRQGVWRSDGIRDGFTEPTWTGAVDSLGLFWASPIQFPVSVVPPVERSGSEESVVVTDDLLTMAGRWIADGWVSCGRVMICCAHREADDLGRLISDAGFKPCRTVGRTATVFCVNRTGLARWLVTHFGCGATGKTVPAWAMGAPIESRRAILEGYLGADGHQSLAGGTADWECCTVSRKLSVGIKLLAQSLGFFTTMYFEDRPIRCVIEGRLVCQRGQWRVEGIQSFTRCSSAARQDGCQWGRVKDVTAGGPQEVFNLTVEGDSSYIADGIVVHNCGHFHQPSHFPATSLDKREMGVWSTGCLCFLSPFYRRKNPWRHGYAVVEVGAGGVFEVTNREVLKDGRVT
jgi:predicted phosphodiesterase